jgi:hypothetical protein
MKRVLGMSLLAVAVFGCATAEVKKSNQLFPGCPDWANLGSGGCPKGTFCDVGLTSLDASGGDKQLAVAQSEADGRAKLAARVKTQVAQRVAASSRATTQNGKGGLDADRVQALLNDVKLDLSGASATNHCVSDDKQVVSLLELDAEAVKSLVAALAKAALPDDVKEGIRAEADKMYEQLQNMK